MRRGYSRPALRGTTILLHGVVPDAVPSEQIDELDSADESQWLSDGELLRARPELRRGDQDSLGGAFVQYRAAEVAYRAGGIVLRYLLIWMTSFRPRMGSESMARTSTPSSPERSVVMASIPMALKSAATRSSKSIGSRVGRSDCPALKSSDGSPPAAAASWTGSTGVRSSGLARAVLAGLPGS
jgi:hypothetical protein